MAFCDYCNLFNGQPFLLINFHLQICGVIPYAVTITTSKITNLEWQFCCNNRLGFVSYHILTKNMLSENLSPSEYSKFSQKVSTSPSSLVLKSLCLQKGNSFSKLTFQVDYGLLWSIYYECMGKVVQGRVARRIMGDFHKLFIWAVMNNLPDMMHLLWSHGEDFLLKSLTGQCALKLMIEIGEKHGMSATVISQYKTQKMYDFRLLFNVCFLVL